MNVRRYEERDLEPLARMTSLAFGDTVEDGRRDYDPEWNLRLDLEQVHIIEEDDEARAGATVLPMEVFVDGGTASMGGISNVFAHPAYRRRGYAGELMRTSLADLRERGVHLSMLWPFNHAFYRAFGYELAGESIRYKLNPRDLETSDEQRNVRAFRKGDVPALIRVFEERAARHQLCVRRGRKVWEKISEREEWNLAVHERDEEIEGYILYRMTDLGDKRCVKVLNFVAATNEARDGLLSFLAAYDSDLLITLDAPQGDPLHPYLTSSYVRASIEPEFMVRLVDVGGALRYLRRSIPESLTLEVTDDVIPQNSGEYAIEGGEILRRNSANYRVRLDVRRLAQLYAGYLPARRLAERGLIQPDSEKALDLLEAYFPTRDPWVFPTDHF